MLKIKKHRVAAPENIESFWWEVGNPQMQPTEIKNLIRAKLTDEANTTGEEVEAAFNAVVAEGATPIGLLILNFENKNMVHVTCTEVEALEFELNFSKWQKSYSSFWDTYFNDAGIEPVAK